MSRSHFPMIPPPYPDPRKWDDIRRLQMIGKETCWMMSKSTEFNASLPFRSSTQHPNSLYADQRDHIGHGSQIGCQTGLDYSTTRDQQYSDSEPFQKSTAVDIVHTNEINGEDLCNYNTVDSCNNTNNDEFHEVEVEVADGEMVDTLELNDFWVKRLSQTVKRMKKKYHKGLKH